MFFCWFCFVLYYSLEYKIIIFFLKRGFPFSLRLSVWLMLGVRQMLIKVCLFLPQNFSDMVSAAFMTSLSRTGSERLVLCVSCSLSWLYTFQANIVSNESTPQFRPCDIWFRIKHVPIGRQFLGIGDTSFYRERSKTASLGKFPEMKTAKIDGVLGKKR